MDLSLLLLIMAFFFIAFLHSQVGFGGGSSYIAILSLFYPHISFIRSIALTCNVAVVSQNLKIFAHHGLFSFRKSFPLVLGSVPMAFLGAQMKTSLKVYLIVLGIVLLMAGLFLIFKHLFKNSYSKKSVILFVFIGAFIGFVSGFVGIGGGILLSPILYFLNWDEPKKIAAASSLFILVNSIAGIVGLIISGQYGNHLMHIALFTFVVLVGGYLGATFQVKKLQNKHVRWVTSVLMIGVATKLLFNSF